MSCIISAEFPWCDTSIFFQICANAHCSQPHSQLDMYQKANGRKSHLVLNVLSWADLLEPKFCFFENVRGFLQYNLNSVQANRYRVRGGVQTGGLKFLVRRGSGYYGVSHNCFSMQLKLNSRSKQIVARLLELAKVQRVSTPLVNRIVHANGNRTGSRQPS